MSETQIQSGEQRARRTPRQILRAILMLHDTPHSIALGTAIGMFIGMTPTVGVQMLLVVVVWVATRRLFHFNRVAALLTVYISNPFTMVPIYWFNYCVGTWFVESTVTYDDFAAALEYRGFSEWWSTVQALIFEVGSPLLIGSAVVATGFGLPTYPVMKWLVRQCRQDRHVEPDGIETRATESIVTELPPEAADPVKMPPQDSNRGSSDTL